MLRLWAFLMVANLVFLGLTVVLARAFRLTVVEVAIGAGPRLVHRAVAGIDLSLRLLPISSFVRFPEDAGIESLASPKRLALALGPFVTLILVGLAGGTPPSLLPTLLVDWVTGALHPLSVGRTLLIGAFDFAHDHPAQAFFACFTAMGLFNLLPWPTLAGWHLVQVLTGKRLNEKAMLIGLSVLAPVAISWLVALLSTFTSP